MKGLQRVGGFTLIELLIAVAIVGIIAAFAYPSYVSQVEKARRSDAQGALMGLAAALERHRSTNGSYLGAGDPNTGTPSIYADQSPVDGSDKFYNLTIDAVAATSYTIRATPINAQVGDGLLELDHTGARWWDKDDDGVADGDEATWKN